MNLKQKILRRTGESGSETGRAHAGQCAPSKSSTTPQCVVHSSSARGSGGSGGAAIPLPPLIPPRPESNRSSQRTSS